MKRRRRIRVLRTGPKLLPGGIAILLVVVGAAFTATNSVSVSRLGDHTVPIDIGDFAPTECAALTLTNMVTGNGLVTGTPSNDLVVGGSGIDTLEGFAGDDCLQGNGGADVLTGGLGNDVCVGGPGLDSFIGCETQVQ